MDVTVELALPGLCMVGLLAGFVMLARRARSGGTAGAGLSGALAAYHEAWHGPAHDAHIEIQAQADRSRQSSRRTSSKFATGAAEPGRIVAGRRAARGHRSSCSDVLGP